MQLEFLFRSRRSVPARENWLLVGNQPVRLHIVRHHRARRYVLRLCPDGTARVTIPRRGSATEARRFVEKNIPWLGKQLLRQAAQPVGPKAWNLGTEILFRGLPTRLEAGATGDSGTIRFGSECLELDALAEDLRPALEQHLWRLARRELVPRVIELAALHQFAIKRVSVRNQRSRWGSCSRKGVISLNWRLIQAPEFVRDYIILHELAHLKEMNHSARFWREVERLCPQFAQAELWLKQNSSLMQ
jgi:predicted metal-dependent hydrolase